MPSCCSEPHKGIWDLSGKARSSCFFPADWPAELGGFVSDLQSSDLFYSQGQRGMSQKNPDSPGREGEGVCVVMSS